jgi:hypothetical protein
VPVLLAATVWYTDVDAVDFSLLAVSAFGLATVINYAVSGLIDRPLTAEFIGCSFVGGPIGMILASRLSMARRRSTLSSPSNLHRR